MSNPARRFRALAWSSIAALFLAGFPAAGAVADPWTIELAPVFVSTYGHDPHVLTIHETDVDGTPAAGQQTLLHLDTDNGIALRAGLRYAAERWGFGLDAFWFTTSQKADPVRAAAGGTIDEVTFELPGRTFTSTDPGEVLFYDQLEDTDLEVWTVDLYALRSLAEREGSALHLLFGLRLGDFDNDYFAAAGVEGVGGTEFGSSSNYGRMTGPVAGLRSTVHVGRNRIDAVFGQAVLLGSASLTHRATDFTGSFVSPTVVAEESFRTEEDAAIPITELRLEWRYALTNGIAVGLGAHTSAWWNVPVPPAVVPATSGTTLREETIVFFGLLAGVELTF